MIQIQEHHGFSPSLYGTPSPEVVELQSPETLSFIPEQIPYIKPRLLVREGDDVAVGTPLIEDKKDGRIKFLSPGSGKIESIRFGPRRVIQNIIIRLDPVENHIQFEKTDEAQLEQIERVQLINRLLEGGIWPLIRELPFRKIADPDFHPPILWVVLDKKDPFQPASDVYLNGREQVFRHGIKGLEKLAPLLYVCADSAGKTVAETYSDLLTHTIQGPYPADDPGVLLYKTKKSSSENRCWYINGQDVLLLGEFLKTGRYPTERMISVGGSVSEKNRHYHTRIGIPIRHAIGDAIDHDRIVCISGGIFSGRQVSPSSYLDFYETSIHLINPEKDRFLGFLGPGTDRISFSKTFLSYFSTTPLPADSGLHGEERACINCSYCVLVCPVEILVQFAYKSILAEAVDEYLAHGLLDCVECGLCSFVCPSKIELTETFKKARQAYFKEIG